MKKIYGLAFATALMALASCSSDDAPEVNKPILDGEAGYITLNLAGVSAGTRGEDDVENVKFYLKQGAKTVSYTEVKKNGNNVIVKVAEIPDNVVAVVNSSADYDSGKLENTDGFYAKGSTPVMSSAVRYDASGAETYKTPITNGHIFKTQAAAEAATASEMVTVNVDRVVAKVSVSVGEQAGKEEDVFSLASGKGFADYTVAFKIDAVYVNGVATETPVKKSLLAASNNSVSIQGGEAIATSLLQGTTGSSHWSATEYGWATTKHFAMSDNKVKGKKAVDEIQIFENCPSTVAGHTRDYTHVIVAGHYVLTGTGAPAENVDFWTFGVKDGKPVIYTSETAVKEAMGGTSSSVLHPVYADNGDGSDGRNIVAYYLDNNKNVTCVKYGKGCVYYAAAIETALTNEGTQTLFGKGVVRNHHYIVKVSEIKGLGVAVADPDTPIIPEDPSKDNGDYYMNLKIQINPFVPLDDQDIKWE